MCLFFSSPCTPSQNWDFPSTTPIPLMMSFSSSQALIAASPPHLLTGEGWQPMWWWNVIYAALTSLCGGYNLHWQEGKLMFKVKSLSKILFICGGAGTLSPFCLNPNTRNQPFHSRGASQWSLNAFTFSMLPGCAFSHCHRFITHFNQTCLLTPRSSHYSQDWGLLLFLHVECFSPTHCLSPAFQLFRAHLSWIST